VDQRQPTSPVEQVERLFAKRLRELRSELGLSQAALAEKLTAAGVKIDDLAILRIEKWDDQNSPNARRVRLGEAVAIAKALESDLHDMLRPDIPLNVQLRHARDTLMRSESAAHEAHERLSHAHMRVDKLEEAVRREEEQARLRSELDEAEACTARAHAELDHLSSQLTKSHQRVAAVAATEGEGGENYKNAQERAVRYVQLYEAARAQAEEGDHQVQMIKRRLAEIGIP
jgi:transcriptional regulator with XRE-family HTH domain